MRCMAITVIRHDALKGTRPWPLPEDRTYIVNGDMVIETQRCCASRQICSETVADWKSGDLASIKLWATMFALKQAEDAL